MKRIWILILVLVLGFVSMGHAATAVTARTTQVGGFTIVTLDVVADGAAGAVADYTVALRPGNTPQYLYFIETLPGAGGAAPASYNITLKDADGGTVLPQTTLSTSAKEYPDATSGVPNYWPMTGNLFLDVSDIGADNSTQVKLIFTK